MAENTKKSGRTSCKHCGQLLGFEVTESWRKTMKVKCPVCGEVNWVMLDSSDNCLFRLVEYEQSGMAPIQIAAMSVLYHEAKKFPELREFIDKWEEKLNGVMAEKKN